MEELINTRNAIEKGQTANKYVSVWPREAVNNAGGEAITETAFLGELADGKRKREDAGVTKIKIVAVTRRGVQRQDACCTG